MAQRYIQGIQLDVCREGQGVWLDPGEQRYLMAWSGQFNPEPGAVRKGAAAVFTVGTALDCLTALFAGLLSL